MKQEREQKGRAKEKGKGRVSVTAGNGEKGYSICNRWKGKGSDIWAMERRMVLG